MAGGRVTGGFRRTGMIGLVAGALVACVVAGCSVHLKRPDIAVVGVERQASSLREQRFLIHLRVTNPNGLDLPIEGVTYSVSVDGDEVGRGDSNVPVTVPAHGSANVDLPLTTNLHLGLGKFLSALAQGSDRLDYRVVGTLRTGIAFYRTLPFDHTGTVQLPVAN